MANDGKNTFDLGGKLQVGTGDIDNSVNVGSDSTVTTNNDTRIVVEKGGTLNYKDAEAIRAEHEERRKDFDNFVDKAKAIGDDIYSHTPVGIVEKTVHKISSGRFDTAADLGFASTNEPDMGMSR